MAGLSYWYTISNPGSTINFYASINAKFQYVPVTKKKLLKEHYLNRGLEIVRNHNSSYFCFTGSVDEGCRQLKCG